MNKQGTILGGGATLYAQTYTYDSIGNITNKSDIGAYFYQNTNYANPHAATSVNGITYTYDNNGNLTNDGTRTYAWDYRNKAASITKDIITHTYTYNHEGERISSNNGTTTTIYPNKLYNTDGTKITKHVFDNEGNTIATVETEAGATAIYYNHQDHLTGSNVLTDSSGSQVQLMDYYPFGGIRLNEKTGIFDEQRKFTGHEYDEDTGLSYMVARYYDGTVGRFQSQDPVHLLIGDDERFEERANRGLGFHLSNPQSLNSYSYVSNNPLKYTDPEGEIFETAVDIVSIGFSANDFNNALSNGSTLAIIGTGAFLTYDVAAAAIPGLPSTLVGKTLFKGFKSLLRFGDKATDAVGGTYKLLDEASNVKRTGRTNNLHRRQLDHARPPETRDLKFEIDKKTDNYYQQRGREQIIYDQHPEARIENGGLNKQNPISNTNPKRQDYLDSAGDL